MKKLIFSSVTLALSVVAGLLLSISTYAQTPQYFTGGGNPSNVYPFGSAVGSKVQLLYFLPTEFNSVPPKGFITAIYFKAASTFASSTFSNLTVNIGNVNLAGLSSGAWNTGLTQGLSSSSHTINNILSGGWFRIPLQNPVYIDNTSNLLVEVSQSGYVNGFGIYTQNPGSPIRRMYGTNGNSSSTGADGSKYDFGFDIFAGYPCDDTPKTELAAPLKICPNDTITISPAKFFADATYQYQYSKNGINWSNFTGTVGLYGEITDVISEPKWYRAKISCNANPNAYYQTKPVKIDIAPFYYCYCKNKAGDSKGLDIGNFKVIARPSDEVLVDRGDPIPMYPNSDANRTYTPNMDSLEPVILYRDSSYEFSVTAINGENSFPVGYAAVYLDWNRDGLYDTVTERVLQSATNINGEAKSTFIIPGASEIGLTGLRAIISKGTPVHACGGYGEGETEDYLANISWEPCSGPVNPGVIEGDSSACVGYDYLLADSTYEKRKSAINRRWQISGDNKSWFDVAGSMDQDILTKVFNGQPVFYRVQAICKPSKDTTYTSVFSLNLKDDKKCYCFSQAIGGLEKDSSDIGGFQLYTLSKQDGGTHLLNPRAIKKRTDYTDDAPLEIDVDSTYQMKVFHTMRTDVHADAKITVFMDFNNNREYDIPEDLVFTGYTSVGNFTLVDNVKVKQLAILNVSTGMRVILNNNIAPNLESDEACGVYTSGETEDYMIMFRKKGFTGIGKVSDLAEWVIHPNPSNGKFMISYTGAVANDKVEITITNVTGQKMYQKQFAVTNGRFSEEINLENQPKGVYLVELRAEDQKLTDKLIIK